MARERATELAGPRRVTVARPGRCGRVVLDRSEELGERRERLVDVALKARVIAREHVEARRELGLERTERWKVLEVLDLVVAAQARDHALETPPRDDCELGGGAASAMLVEQRNEAVRLAPKAVVNLEPESSRGRWILAPRGARMPFEPRANLASPRESLFRIGVQARIVLERLAFVARLG